MFTPCSTHLHVLLLIDPDFASATQILLGVLLFCVSKRIEATGGPQSLSRNSYVAVSVTLVQLRCQELNATDTYIYSTYIQLGNVELRHVMSM